MNTSEKPCCFGGYKLLEIDHPNQQEKHSCTLNMYESNPCFFDGLIIGNLMAESLISTSNHQTSMSRGWITAVPQNEPC